MKKEDLKIGQILYDLNCKEYIVSKVGIKYFECIGYRNKFDLKTMRVVSEYTSNIILNPNRQEVLDENETLKLESEIRSIIKPYGKTNLPLEKLRQIISILK